MVIFHSSNLERELSPEELEKQRLRAIQNSPEWQRHADLHRQAGLPPAQLHTSSEPILGEEDTLRTRLGLPQREQAPAASETRKADQISYGTQHTTTVHATYTSAGSQPGLWASCNCGAEFKAQEKKDGSVQVTSYGVVGSDAKATSYLINETKTSYGNQESTSVTYGTTAARKNTYNL